MMKNLLSSHVNSHSARYQWRECGGGSLFLSDDSMKILDFCWSGGFRNISGLAILLALIATVVQGQNSDLVPANEIQKSNVGCLGPLKFYFCKLCDTLGRTVPNRVSEHDRRHLNRIDSKKVRKFIKKEKDQLEKLKEAYEHRVRRAAASREYFNAIRKQRDAGIRRHEFSMEVTDAYRKAKFYLVYELMQRVHEEDEIMLEQKLKQKIALRQYERELKREQELDPKGILSQISPAFAQFIFENDSFNKG